MIKMFQDLHQRLKSILLGKHCWDLGDDKAFFDPDNMADLQIRVMVLINNAYTNLFDQSVGALTGKYD